jgi:predicted nucleic acid-binding protein
VTIEAIARARRVYVDSNVFIYFLESAPGMQEAARRIFAIAEKTNAPLITSELTLAECLYGAYKLRDEALAHRYRSLFQQRPALVLAGIDMTVLDAAAKIGPQSGLKLMDAIHVATAVEADCDVFATNDARIRDWRELQVVQLATLA